MIASYLRGLGLPLTVEFLLNHFMKGGEKLIDDSVILNHICIDIDNR